MPYSICFPWANSGTFRFFWGDGHFSSVQSMGAIVRSCHPVLIWALMYLINKGALFSLTVVTPWFLRGRRVAQGYAVNNPLAAIKGALTMIIMIKGIHLITGLLNYSSVEARLFGRMLIIPPHSWQVLFQSTSLSFSLSLSLREPNTLAHFHANWYPANVLSLSFPFFFRRVRVGLCFWSRTSPWQDRIRNNQE